MLSEAYYPAWRAYVDGRPVRLYRADYLLRAVPVPAGEHAVELRYESVTLQAGIAVSLAAGAMLVAVAIAVGVRRREKAGAVEAPAPYFTGSVEALPPVSVEREAP